MTFSVHVDTASERFQQGAESGGNILSEFYVGVDDDSFPSRDWIDFPVIILAWWLKAYRKMRRHGQPVGNSFMNGPFEFETVPSDDRITVRFVRRTREGDIEARDPTEVDRREYEQALLTAGEAVVGALARGHEGPDVGVLESELRLVRALRDRHDPS